MSEDTRRVPANVCSYVDEDSRKLSLEVPLPGVKKEDIKLKMVDDSFSLTAKRDDIEYVSASMFCCPVKANEAKAIYEDGLLTIQVPFKDPMDGAKEITIH